MSSYYMVMTVLNRNLEDEYINYFEKHDIVNFAATLGNGTASKSLIGYLGVERNEKVIIQSIVAEENVKSLFSGLVSRMGINLPGTGIAMSIPIESIAGRTSREYLTKGQEHLKMEEHKLEEMLYSLIVVILERGCSDMVMDAARDAGAKGGTIIHAKGTAKGNTSKFFGLTIAPEKELIYIVTRRTDKDEIMRNIIRNAGPHTEAKAIVFSVPVEDVVGLTTLMYGENN